MSSYSRRKFLRCASMAATVLVGPYFAEAAAKLRSQFRIAVISDEISDDFDHACYIASHDFGMSWLELRSMWGKNLTDLSSAELANAEKIMAKYDLHATDVASPLFKTDWPGAPLSPYRSKADLHLAPESTSSQQDAIFERCVDLAKRFKTEKIRCFDFWRLTYVLPYREAIDDKLRSTAEAAGKQGVLLLIENEPSCNTATVPEAMRVLNAVRTPHFALNLDAANAVMSGGLDSFRNGWNTLSKDRIHHCHIKNLAKNSAGKWEWSPIDKGVFNWAAQFVALKQLGYRDAVSLETHWRGAGSAEASTRICWAGMKTALQQAGAV